MARARACVRVCVCVRACVTVTNRQDREITSLKLRPTVTLRLKEPCRERERERQRQRDTHRDTETGRQDRDRQTDREPCRTERESKQNAITGTKDEKQSGVHLTISIYSYACRLTRL